MNELEMCKKIAELEGVEWKICELDKETTLIKSGGIWFEICYIKDLGANCALRDKYEVNILHDCNEVEVEIGDCNLESLAVVECKKEDIPRAVIECILKANNLWTGD